MAADLAVRINESQLAAEHTDQGGTDPTGAGADVAGAGCDGAREASRVPGTGRSPASNVHRRRATAAAVGLDQGLLPGTAAGSNGGGTPGPRAHRVPAARVAEPRSPSRVLQPGRWAWQRWPAERRPRRPALARTCTVHESTGAASLLVVVGRFYAHALLLIGDRSGARRQVDRALETGSTDDVLTQGLARSALAWASRRGRR